MPAATEDDAALESEATDGGRARWIGRPAVAVGDDLDADEQPEPTDLTDVRLVAEGGRDVLEDPAAERRRAVGQTFCAEYADRRASGRKVDRVAHERRRVCAGCPVAHETRPADDGRDRHPAADPLAGRHEIRNDAPVLGRPEPAGPPEPRLDLVEDQYHAVAVAQLAEPGKEPVRRDDDPAVALDGLDDDRRDRSESRRRVLEGVTNELESGLAGRLARPQGPAVGIRVGQEMGVRVAPDGRPDGGLAGEPDDTAAAPEIAARERDDLAAAGQRPCELQSRVVGVRAGQPEEHAIESWRRDVEKRLLEPDAGLADRRRRDVPGTPGLVADGGDDRRVAVADRRRREARTEVDEPVAVRICQDRAERLINHERVVRARRPRSRAFDGPHAGDHASRAWPRVGRDDPRRTRRDRRLAAHGSSS